MTTTVAAAPALDAPIPHDEFNGLLSLMAGGFAITRCTRLIAEFGIADALDEAPATATEIAARAGVDAGALGRILRFAATFGIFASSAEGRFSHTVRSR